MKTMTKTFLTLSLLAFAIGMSPAHAHEMNKKQSMVEKVECDGAKSASKTEGGKSIKSEEPKTQSRLGSSLTGMGAKRL